MARNIVMDWPVIKFRWEDTEYAEEIKKEKEVFRYDDKTGTMVVDDGEPSMAFAWDVMALYVEIPYRENILGGWQTDVGDNKGMYTGGCRQSWMWCYATRDGKPDFDESYPDRDSHPNEIAGRVAMKFTFNRHGCANGRGIDHPAYLKGPTKEHPCAYCANNGRGHKRDDTRSKISYLTHDIECAERELDGARHTVSRGEGALPRMRDNLARLKESLEDLDA